MRVRISFQYDALQSTAWLQARRHASPLQSVLTAQKLVLTIIVQTPLKNGRMTMTRPRSPKATTISPRKFDSVEQSAYLNLWRTYDLLKAYEDRLFSEYDLSAQQYNTLRLLKAVHPGRVPTLELGTRLVSRAPDMTRLLDRLEARGLIDRERLPENRRVVEIGITPEGVKLLSTLSRQVTECHSRQLGHMNAEELEMLNRLLDRCREPHEPPDSHWPKAM